MKKTLTVNLGGTVFHIDEDAYQLLDKYLSNLRIHFKKEEGSDEILNDFELRISEILNERIRLGYEVITIEHVENVIKRMGKIEEIFEEGAAAGAGQPKEEVFAKEKEKEKEGKRLFRNPDDRILGGVCSGIAAYFNWDPTPVRILLFFLIFVYGITIPIYLILWLIVPVATTATEKLQMKGESITVENIGKTVTGGFEKMSNNVNEYISSDKPRTGAQRLADGFVSIIGLILKVLGILVAIILFPPLLFALFIILIVLIALIAGGIGGSFGLLYHILPQSGWEWFGAYPEWQLALMSISTILLIGIPVLSFIYMICSSIFHFKPLPKGVKVTLLVLWLLSVVANIIFAAHYGLPFWGDYRPHWRPIFHRW